MLRLTEKLNFTFKAKPKQIISTSTNELHTNIALYIYICISTVYGDLWLDNVVLACKYLKRCFAAHLDNKLCDTVQLQTEIA